MKIRGGINPLQFWGGLLIRSQKSAAKSRDRIEDPPQIFLEYF